MAKKSMIILYVADQDRSRLFYQTVLNKIPLLDVPGMTEFELGTEILLGLMPEKGIAKILTPSMPDPASGSGIPRCELYLIVPDPADALIKALMAGAKLVSTASERTWGDEVAYCADPDGHVIAFAR